VQFRNGRFSPGPPLPFHANFLDCFEDGQHGLWFSLVANGFLRLDGQGWHHFPIQRTGIDPTIILADRQGRLLAWVLSRRLVRISYPRVESLWEFKDMPGGNIHALYQGGGDVLIGSASGLSRIHEGRIQVLRAAYPWLKDVTGLVETQGETWVLASRGIARLSSRDLAKAFEDPGHVLHPQIFDSKDGLLPFAPFYAKNSAGRGGDGRVWFATREGIVWIDPAHLARNTLPPPVSIRTLTANGQRYRDPGDLELPQGVSGIEIDYNAPSLSIPERVRFRYKLDGVDPDWVDAGARRQAFYTNLGPGTYRFQVIAANNDGVWNREGATLTVTIPPTFFQSTWFKLLCALLVLGVLSLAYSLHLRRMAARLQAGLEVRLAERERIARELHDTLLQGFQGLVLRFQAIANRIPGDQPLRSLVDQTLDRADAVLIDGRNRVHELRTATVAGDLGQSLIAAASEFTADPPVRLELTVEGRQRALHPIAREEIQRIGEEAIRNAFQHAGASRVEVTIAYHRSELRLDVRDDGVGLPRDVAAAGKRAGHFGLTGMRERAARIGGALTIVSREGAGTEVLLSIPGRAAYVTQHRRWGFAAFRAARPED
jgi:signal transduction histidine kinase